MKAPYLRVRIATKTPGRSTKAAEIVKSLHNEIICNSHASGCQLPPVRALAHQLGISKNTVHSAYEELVSRDLVITKERQGFFVKETALAKNIEIPFQAGTTTFSKPLIIPHVDDHDVINLSSVFIDPDWSGVTKTNSS